MSPTRSSTGPVVRVLSPVHTARVLRAHLLRHNLRVMMLAGITLLFAAALWVLLYGAICWLLLLALSAGASTDAEIPRTLIRWFAGIALASLFWVWIARRLVPGERPRDKKTPWEVVGDFLFAIPRMTLSIFDTISALRRLSDAECEQAAALIHRLADVRRMPLPSVPQEIPDETTRERVLL